MSDSLRLHRQQPTRLPCPSDSPGKNTGVGCHFLLQCMKVKSESEVAQSCPTLSNPMDCSLPGSSVHGIFQARVLEWGCHCLFLALASVSQFSCSVMSDSSRPHGPRPTRLLCPWDIPRQEYWSGLPLIAGFKSKCVCDFVRHYRSSLQNECTNLYSHQQCT